MSDTIKVTPEAKDANTQIGSITDGGLTDQINSLNQQAQILADPNVWDGPHAEQFRNEIWPSVHKRLTDAAAAVNEVKAHSQTIHSDISQAGGGAA